MSPDKTSLCRFLIDSNNAGYAGGVEKEWIKESDGSTTIPFKKGRWKSHDNFFGGEPYGGRMVVYYDGAPFWIMVYYGWIEKGFDVTPIYQVLKSALRHMPHDYPFRGPKVFKCEGHKYTNTWKGQIDRFTGKEQIVKVADTVYEARYMGGLIDRKSDVLF
ncbi:MAG: DUF5680 domain-containing protein [Patescibacteria group bacterium]